MTDSPADSRSGTGTVRFGIIGVGAAGSEIQAITRHPHLTIAAAADHDPAALDRFHERFPSAARYLSVEELCASADVDAVFIGTPTPLHTAHTLLAIEGGKHVIVAKPMALSLEDAERTVSAAERAGVFLMVGHTQGYEPVVAKIREIIAGGSLGPLRMINSWYYTDWIYRGRVPEELDTAQGGGVVYRQGAHHFDVLRLIGGSKIRSVRAMTGAWDANRATEGAYVAFLDFEGGAAATAVFNGYDHFHSVELGFPIGEGGQRVTSEEYASARKALAAAGEGGEADLKRRRRSGELRRGSGDPKRYHSFYGLTIVSCERGEIRQSPDGLIIYDEQERREFTFEADRTGRDVMVDEMYRAVASGEPPLHDGRWGLGTLEVCLAVLESGRKRREVFLYHQVAVRA